MNLRRGWGSPLNPPVCPACGTANPMLATTCTKCRYPLPTVGEIGGHAVAGTGPAPESKEIANPTDPQGAVMPSYLKNENPRKKLSTIPPGALAGFQPMPVSSMGQQRIVTGIGLTWPLWTWGLVLVLFVGGAVAVLIDYLFQTTSEPTIKSRGEEVATVLGDTQPSARVLVENDEEVLPVESKTKAKPTAPISNFPVTSAHLPGSHQTARIVRQSKNATVHEAGTGVATGKNTARATGSQRQRLIHVTAAPAQNEFTPPAGTQCSAAVKALALCSAPAN